MEANTTSINVQVHAPVSREISELLTPDALRFVGFLCSHFEERRQSLLSARKAKALAFDAGEVPHFVSEKQYSGDWKCATVPSDVQDRRVEITGPVDRKVSQLVSYLFS
jgi:malate synthase